MLILAYITLALALLLSINQSLVVGFFARVLLAYKGPPKSKQTLPKAAVILALRGPDPDLDEVLEGLLKQDYSNYSVYIIVDSITDPSWQDIRRAQSKFGKSSFNVSTLQKPSSSCSLKCSSLIEAVEGLDPEYEIVAFIDGDAPPHRTWLASLVEALDDSDVGVTYGNRWFMPEKANCGSLVRYFWNVGAVVQLWLSELVWAGSMAMRKETIYKVALLDAWSNALADDVAVQIQMKKHGYKIRFVPGVIQANRELISLSHFIRWVERQMIAAKTSATSWRLAAIHAINLVGIQVIAVSLLSWGLLTSNSSIVNLTVAALILYWTSSLFCVLALEFTIQRNMRINKSDTNWMTLPVILNFLPSMVITHFAYAYAIIRAIFLNRFSWRGIEYQIDRKGVITMTEYHPFDTKPKELPTESVL